MQFTQYAFAVSVILILLVFLIQKIRGMFVVNSYSLSREVENGEGMSVAITRYSWESDEAFFQKVQKAVAPIEMRKKFCFDRFQEILEEAKAEQAQGK